MMGMLPIDEENVLTKRSPMVIGKVEFLPTVQPLTATAAILELRRRSAEAIEKHAAKKQSASVHLFKPLISTVAPCELCLEHARFGSSALCAGCIGRKAEKLRRSNNLRNPFERKITASEYLMVCAACAVLIGIVALFSGSKDAIRRQPVQAISNSQSLKK